VALFVGFDPGGTGRKIAHISAAVDDDDRLFIGHLRVGSFGNPGLELGSFPYLDAPTLAAIEDRIRSALVNVLESTGSRPPAGDDPLACALHRFGTVVVSVDASSGFAVAGNRVRHTESVVGANYTTPDEATFLSCASAWLRAGNLTPLHQRVFWKLVGLAIYRTFTAAGSAGRVAAAASAGIESDLTSRVAPGSGLHVFESFPSETYRATAASPAMARVRCLAARRPVNLPSAALHPTTFAAFRARLKRVARGDPDAWARSPGRRVGDALDSFASMMLGAWAMERGLRACGSSLPLMRAEGTIVLPR
jgi:hypothetical protein